MSSNAAPPHPSGKFGTHEHAAMMSPSTEILLATATRSHGHPVENHTHGCPLVKNAKNDSADSLGCRVPAKTLRPACIIIAEFEPKQPARAVLRQLLSDHPPVIMS